MQPRRATPQGLALTLPSAVLAPQGASLDYLRGAVTSRMCVGLAVFATCIGLGYASLLGAMVALVVVLGTAAWSARLGVVRRHLDAQTTSRARSRREHARLEALRPAGAVRQTHYLELRDLVDEVERLDAREAARFELQELLDHFVRLAICHQRCLDALRLAGSHELTSATPITEAHRGRHRREIHARRIRHRDACVRQLEWLHDELEAIDELLRLVAQRTACPSLTPELDREIERRLWELDEVDAAMAQLSA